MRCILTVKAKNLLKLMISERVYRSRVEQLISQRRSIAILMYHEIAPRQTQAFRQFPVQCTTPDTFQAQAKWLAQHFEIISMDEDG